MQLKTLNIENDWNPKMLEAKELMKRKATVADGIRLCGELNRMLHSSTDDNVKTFNDQIFDG